MSEPKRTRFLQACQICINGAKKQGKQLYVEDRGDDFVIIDEFSSDWLFRAYPGGRKVLSTKGAKLV